MKTIKNIFSLKAITTQVVLLILILASCQKDNDILTSIDTQYINAESAGSSYLSEGSDISANAIGNMSSTQYSGARVDGDLIPNLANRDDRFKCSTATITRTGTKDNPSGTITITFDPTCSDSHGVKRSGTILISYSGRRWSPGSYFAVKTDFYRNNIHIEGVDTVTTQLSADSVSGGYLQFHSVLTDGKVTFSDGKNIVTHTHNVTNKWLRASIPTNNEWHTLAGGQAGGTSKNGDTYSMSIQEDLIYKISCLTNKVVIPVKGKKMISIFPNTNREKDYTIDFGDGTCDNTVVVTLHNKQTTITVNGDGN